jgi:hypothetical protein
VLPPPPPPSPLPFIGPLPTSQPSTITPHFIFPFHFAYDPFRNDPFRFAHVQDLKQTSIIPDERGNMAKLKEEMAKLVAENAALASENAVDSTA